MTARGWGERAIAPLVAGAIWVLLGGQAIAADFPGRGLLPQDRAWEMVSPPGKNGNDVLVDSGRIAFSSGEGGLPAAVMFASVGTFLDPAGGSNAIDYLSRRTLGPQTPGWDVHPLTPPQLALRAADSQGGREPVYEGVSSDIAKGIFRSYSSLPGTPDEVADLQNLYLRDDLRDGGPGSFRLLTACTFGCSISRDLGRTRFVAASADFSKILIATNNPLTADAPVSALGEAGLYEASGQGLRNIGYIPTPPATECAGLAPNCEPAPRAIPGHDVGLTYAFDVLSRDGRRAFFTVGFRDTESGDIYIRDDRGTAQSADDTSIKLNASERDVPEPEEAATFWDASANGARAFFTSAEALTDDAPIDGEQKLYMWTLEADGEGHHLSYLSADGEPADTAGPVRGTLGASEGGSYLYFVQDGQIVAGEPTLGSVAGIYRWHQGEGVRYLGEMLDPADVSGDLAGPQRTFNEGGDETQHLAQVGARVTPDGRSLLLSLRQPPRPAGPDHGDCPDDGGTAIGGEVGCRQLYLYGGTSVDEPVCVSCPPDAAAPRGPAFFGERLRRGVTATTRHQNRPLSDDGRFVFFSTGERLDPADVDGGVDAYVFDASTGSRRLISSGESSSPSYFLEASGDGRDALLVTRDRLSAWDTDTSVDIYDARVGGGVPEPSPDLGPECTGDACMPAPSALAPLRPDSADGAGRRRGASRCRRPGGRRGRRAIHRRVKRRATRRRRCAKRRHSPTAATRRRSRP